MQQYNNNIAIIAVHMIRWLKANIGETQKVG